jgi:two-component system, cell cycle response regulator CtrA
VMHRQERIAGHQDPVRRHQANPRSIITVGKLAINLDAKRVTLDSSRVHVTVSEYQMLELLALRRGSCVTRDAFMNYLYGEKCAPKPKILDVFICKLRKKLSVAADTDKRIETVWGRGYLLNDRANQATSSFG